MIDDLVSLPFDEPYRMLTSRAEYRLVLRSDTADARMLPEASRLGLISDQRAEQVRTENTVVEETLHRLATLWFGSNPIHSVALEAAGIQPANRSLSALDIVRRPQVSLHSVLSACAALGMVGAERPARYALERVEIAAKYASFIEKEEREVVRHAASDLQAIPSDVNFARVAGLRVEARQKLQAARPTTVGQARKTGGVTPTDVGALLVHLATENRSHHLPREVSSV